MNSRAESLPGDQPPAPPGEEEQLALPGLLARVRPLLAQQPTPVYLVGGAVRDALLGLPSHDLDFVVAEGAIPLAFAVGDALGAPAFAMDRERDIGRVVLADGASTLDFARFRAPDLEGDLRSRDFTLNAMALPVAAEAPDVEALIDPTGGMADLRVGLVRITHEGAIADDPLRTLRALRVAARFGFVLTPETARAVEAAASDLATISPERVRDELLKLLATSAPGRSGAAAWGMRRMADLALLPVVLPEIAALAGVEQSAPHHEAVLAHSFSVLDWLPRVEAAALGEAEDNSFGGGPLAQVGPALAPYREELQAHLARDIVGETDGRALLRLAALFHDAGKAETQKVEADGRIRFFGHDEVGARIAARRLRALRFSTQAIRHVASAVAGHMRPLFLNQAGQVSRRAAFRFFRDTGAAGLDIGLISLADHLATHDGPGAPGEWEGLVEVVARLYHNYFDAYEEAIAPPPLVDGNQLMRALELEPGPEVGRLLRLLEEAQAAGDVTTEEEALALARWHHRPRQHHDC